MKLRHQSKLGNRNKLSLILSLSMLLLVGCKDAPLDSDPDYPYYTISGRVFEGYGEAPLANAKIQLEYLDEGSNFLEGSEGGKLKSVKTDEDGYFTLDYQGFTGSPPDRELDGLYLYADGRLLLEAFPWNEDVDRDFAEKNHSRIHVEVSLINESDLPDTLYVSVSRLLKGTNVRSMYMEQVGQAYNVLAIPIEASQFEFDLRSEWGASWDLEPYESVLAYGLNPIDFQQAHLALVLDSVSDDFNRIRYRQTGFPVTDTVKLVVD